MRQYEGNWIYLRENLEAEWGIDVDLSDPDGIQDPRKIFNTFRKAVRKEKYIDEEFREMYPNAQVNWELRKTDKSNTGFSIYAKLKRNSRSFQLIGLSAIDIEL